MTKKKGSPEDRFYDSLKGERVQLTLGSGESLVGILRWVDTYSIGIARSYHATEGGVADATLVMKGELATLEKRSQ